ncbi:hypothetical protein SAMD00019534_110510, partial [Acytostelium subglobosum LB1]|uniref:hypothetical protein n=1 Tax=Acytostelium subglobosum LB1 TaxID=1410327 RepID=UPI00064501F7
TERERERERDKTMNNAFSNAKGLYFGDPLVDDIKSKQQDNEHDLVLLEARLADVEHEMSVMLSLKQELVDNIQRVKKDKYALDQRMVHCKHSVLLKWKHLAAKFGFSESEAPSIISLLPTEVMLNIFGFLSFQDISFSVSRVSKLWHRLSMSDVIWKYLFQCKWNTLDVHHQNESKPLKVIASSFWSSPILPPSQPPNAEILPSTIFSTQQPHTTNPQYSSSSFSSFTNNVNNSINNNNNINVDVNNNNNNNNNIVDANNNNNSNNHKRVRIDWRELYLKRLKIEHNWWTSNCRSKKFPGHSDWTTCMQFDAKILVTGSWDSSLKLWNIDTGDCVVLSSPQMGGHQAGITCIQFKGNRLISGSSDATLRIWDLSTGDCLHVLRGHTEGVSCLTIIDDNTVASGSLDNTINLWSIETGKLLHSFSTHVTGITCLYYKNNLLISGTMGGVLNVIDLPSRIVVQTLHGHSDRVTSIQWWDNPNGESHIVSSSWDYTLRVWNIQTGRAIHVLSGHTFRVRCTYIRGNILVSGSWDTTVRVWDLLTGKCIHTLIGHSFNVWGVQFEGKRLVTAGWDRKVKVWDIETGKLLYTLEGHTESIICLQFKGSKLVTAAKEIIVWDFD